MSIHLNRQLCNAEADIALARGQINQSLDHIPTVSDRLRLERIEAQLGTCQTALRDVRRRSVEPPEQLPEAKRSAR